MIDTESSGLDIRLNPKTGIESHKGVALEAFVKAYQLSSIVIVADDRQDLAMRDKAQSLIVDNKFRKSLERMGPDGNSSQMYQDSRSNTEKHDDVVLIDYTKTKKDDVELKGDEKERAISGALEKVKKTRAAFSKALYRNFHLLLLKLI